ncbi:crossover junction endodeoxyribonuclease RuvC [Candidatus Roizmanbacteria bacterium CG_4_10_14_0_8_um_filter_33_9]|uniref:Crossover junction endodeoxyribonuclease RuvC n=1 Tax=Candidatus Roizmanbacteria bacterium CG_4_10_14_0_8_um_filter_33_9 TaxID=1974826 RepID=A0A2M7QI75_9BACT|nr:MAG: crossover junction endodeoxyribonuclease RuvC [Candidatus Roizmanbacteria bacterium CG_4_10_14_0_8_um_filter_33_9]
MIILSIDPGVERVGYALFNKKAKQSFSFLSAGLIQTKKSSTTSDRFKEIYLELEIIITTNKPEKIILEKLFFFKNKKTLISVAQAQGVIMLIASQNSIPIVFFTPLQIKQIITGYGRADKQTIQKMLRLTLGNIKEILQDDTADAIACGLSYCYWNEELA